MFRTINFAISKMYILQSLDIKNTSKQIDNEMIEVDKLSFTILFYAALVFL